MCLAHDDTMNNPDITLYGIPNCDTVKKSRTWLATRGCSYHFHDFKQQGIPADLLARWTAPTTVSARFVQDVCAHFHVIERQGELLACGAFDAAASKVDAVFVAPWAMRQGLATAMLAHLEGLAREAGCTRMWLEATLNAEPFYRAQGFLALRRDQYASPRGFTLDCVVMEKPLG